MKGGFSLLQFKELLCIGGILLLVTPIAGSTEVVEQGKPDTGRRSLLDSQLPSIYLIRDTAWIEHIVYS